MQFLSNSTVKTKQPRKKKLPAFFPLVFIAAGLLLFFWVLYPIISFKLFYEPKFSNLVRPIPSERLKAIDSSSIQNTFSSVLGTVNKDYTKASVWFPKAVKNVKIGGLTKYYQLSIPKLKIEDAIVTTEGEDLTRSLVQYTGPLPGNFGNPVIFGHSTTPFLYNPKDYKSIFTKLPDLKTNDEIFLTIDNITYKYQVVNMRITKPDDLSVLDQDYDGAYLTLITCVPPGTYLERLAVKAILVTI